MRHARENVTSTEMLDFTDTISADKARLTVFKCVGVDNDRNNRTDGRLWSTAAQVVHSTTSRCVIQKESDVNEVP